jgi:hypothetical protein
MAGNERLTGRRRFFSGIGFSAVAGVVAGRAVSQNEIENAESYKVIYSPAWGEQEISHLQQRHESVTATAASLIETFLDTRRELLQHGKISAAAYLVENVYLPALKAQKQILLQLRPADSNPLREQVQAIKSRELEIFVPVLARATKEGAGAVICELACPNSSEDPDYFDAPVKRIGGSETFNLLEYIKINYPVAPPGDLSRDEVLYRLNAFDNSVRAWRRENRNASAQALQSVKL